MNSREAIKCLCEDMEKIELPPISEEVLLALSEQRQKYIEYTKKTEALNKQKNDKIKKYAFAAMLALLAISVPVVVVLTNHAPISDLPNASVLPGSSEAARVSESQIATSTTESETALEHIKLKQSYGEVALSGKSEEELEMLLVTYSKENSAYEDEQYIYNFDSQGRLLEMRSLFTEFDKEFSVTKQVILDEVKALLDEYYSEWDEDSYSVSVDENTSGYPAWTVTIKKDNSISTEKITMLFFNSGKLHWMRFDGTSNNDGVISKAEAVQIALEELRSGKYKLQKFENKDIEITVNIKAIDNKQYYEINVEKIPYEIVNGRIYCVGYLYLVDSNTGECSIVAHSP